MTINIQKEQRDKGKTFVSRTALASKNYHNQTLNVFRVVLANPLTETKHLTDILAEQRKIAKEYLLLESDWVEKFTLNDQSH